MAMNNLDLQMKAVPTIIVRPWTAVAFIAMAATMLSPPPGVGFPFYPAIEAMSWFDSPS